MSRIAYMISAYKDVPHLQRLVNALDDNADFYVHVDRKVDIAPFREALGQKVVFVSRHWVSWGGWEQVEYQKALLDAVVESGIVYSRVVCLSGQDYPLWSNGEIRRFFDRHEQTEYIAAMELGRSCNAGQLRKVECYHFFRDLRWRNLWLKNKLVVASRWVMQWLPFRRESSLRIGDVKVPVYFGSDYWALTLPCARYVHKVLNEHYGELRHYFRSCFVPSELCVSTIVFNSPFAGNALLYEEEYAGLAALTPLHYINYGAEIKVLGTEDWTLLQQSGKMFCRKVVSGASDALVRLIDARRNGDGTAACGQ